MSYARQAVTRLTLDMSLPDVQKGVTVTQGDTNRRLEVSLIDRGMPFALPPNWTAVLAGMLTGGDELYESCIVTDGRIIFDFVGGPAVSSEVGNFPVSFDIFDEGGELVASPKVWLHVVQSTRRFKLPETLERLTALQDFVKNINEVGNELTNLDERIDDLEKKITSAGIVTIQADAWTDATPTVATFNIPVLDKGQAVIILPANNATKQAATSARMSAYPTPFLNVGSYTVNLIRAEAENAPTVDMTFVYVVISTESSETPPVVALIGVDAYGEGGGGTGGVDAEAVAELIREIVPEWARGEPPKIPEVSKDAVGLGNVVNELQYSAKNPPPYPVNSVNGKTGAVSLSAGDVGARPSSWTPTAAEVGARSVTWTPSYSDVGADKSGTATTAVYNHNKDNDAHEYIQQRVDALQTLIENFLDIDNESFDQLSEILRDIKANASALELLGTNKIDKTAISTSLTDSNPDHVASMSLIVSIDNALTVVEEAIEDLKTNKQTAEQVADAIKAALTSYITSDKAAELYQPKGDYLTTAAGDQRYAKPSQIPTVPTALPNPNGLTILGKTYDGSAAVSVEISDILAALPASEEVAV